MARSGAGWDWPVGYASAAAVADAVLYEGYLLYPYRKSAGKNRLRWQFGVLAPQDWALANLPADDSISGAAESWFQQCELLVERHQPNTRFGMRLRFLHSQQREIFEAAPDGTFLPCQQLDVDGRLLLSFDEAVALEYDVGCTLDELSGEPRAFRIDAPGSEAQELVRDATGAVRARIVRRRQPLAVAVTASAMPVPAPFPLLRMRIRVANVSGGLALHASRDEALARSLLATHTFVMVAEGAFLSLLDPPEWARAAARDCHNVHTMPVLAGDEGSTGMLLCSPIILYDYPRIAPESPGDLFDAGEIDEILSLRTLTLTDDEKREARATDPRAAAIVDRVEASAPDVFERLHGTIRSRPEPDAAAWWEPGADDGIAPESERITVGGVQVGKGSRVRLQPRPHGTDAHDMFLAGRYARVEAVMTDVDESRFVAVSIEDDPAADLQRTLRRFFHFSPDEIVPVDPP